ncbi:hypothetical protein Tco_0570005 [Tanacetum coccineum]
MLAENEKSDRRSNVKSWKVGYLVKESEKGKGKRQETQLEEMGKHWSVMLEQNRYRRKGRTNHDDRMGRVLLDGGAACDIMYEHCFLNAQKRSQGIEEKTLYLHALGILVFLVLDYVPAEMCGNPSQKGLGLPNLQDKLSWLYKKV